MTDAAKSRYPQRGDREDRAVRRLDRELAAQRAITPLGPHRGAQSSLARTHVAEAQRARIIAAMVELVNEHGDETVAVSRVISAAKVSRRTFYELFEDRGDCLVAAIEWGVTLAGLRVSAAYNRHDRWVDRVRAGLCELLRFFDEEPSLASLCVVRSAGAGPIALALRWETLDRLTRVVDEGRAASRREPPPLTSEGIVGGVLGVIHKRLLNPDTGPLLDLLGPLMSMIVLPYLGDAAARKELARPDPPVAVPGTTAEPKARNPLESISLRLTHRTVGVLHAIADEPGLSNKQIGERSGIVDQAQISRLLTRLADLGLMENTGGGRPMGTTNAWRLTPTGEEVECAIWGKWPSAMR
jgi:AcrR family transcriptional regulator